MTTPDAQEKSSTGLDPNVAAALAYLVGAVTGFVMLALEKESRFVRFHAAQSVAFSLAVAVVVLLVGGLPVLDRVLVRVTVAGAFVIWVLLIIRALQFRRFKLPYLGDLVEQQLR